ncbi:MAG: hypothetical protein EBX99_02130, partial [Acidimicrobiia bacterium]|nr:hypothetical protein [Acidimicrobiia bacterium]
MNSMNNPRYTARELAFIEATLVRLTRRLNSCGLPIVLRDEVASAMDEYLTRKVSDLVVRYPSGAKFVDAGPGGRRTGHDGTVGQRGRGEQAGD